MYVVVVSVRSAVAELLLQMDARAENIDVKIQKLDKELLRYKQQLKKARSASAKNSIKQRAMRVLKQKKCVRFSVAAVGIELTWVYINQDV